MSAAPKAPRESAARGEGSKLKALEARVNKLTELVRRVDAALADPNAFRRDAVKAGELTKQRRELVAALEKAEEDWLAMSVETEGV